MRKLTNLATAASLTLSAMLATSMSAWASVEPYPLEYFALREVTNAVTISPDGERVAMLKILTREGNPILHIYDADDMDGDAFVVDSDPMEITSYYWASDEHIVLTLRQKTRNMVKGQEDSVYDYRIAILDVEEEEFKGFDAARPVVENVLANVPGKVIISEQPDLDNPFALDDAFRPRAYYELDLDRGTKKLVMRGKWSVAQTEFDAEGNPRVARGFDVNSGEFIIWYRDPGEKSWRDVMRIDENNFQIWMEDFEGFDDAVPGNMLMKAFNGHDKLGLWSFNPDNGNYEELLYRRSDVDVYGVRKHSNFWKFPDRVTAVGYFKDRFHFEYFDEIEGATFKQLEELIPYSHYVTITSRSRDGDSLVAYNVGPRDPGTYYLLHDGQFKPVGSKQPLFDSEDLSDVEYFEYKARDGKKLAAFMTIPKGEPPYPTVVMPHGGPHVLEVVLYNEWAQMLANNGYLVVQPQYRMSMGYGFDHFTSAFLNGSQAGRMMQDDKDDAVLHLVREGIADPDRLAMYGWSYGGYAALVAASRTPQIYQCTIAGAAVTSYIQAAIDGFRGRSPRGTGKVWDEVYERGAVQPVEEVAKVNVPILLIHGDVDSRVLPKQADLYLKELEKHNKYHKMVWLEGADHFSNTLFYEHQITLYESLINFLHNDCGMKTPQTELHASTDD